MTDLIANVRWASTSLRPSFASSDHEPRVGLAIDAKNAEILAQSGPLLIEEYLLTSLVAFDCKKASVARLKATSRGEPIQLEHACMGAYRGSTCNEQQPVSALSE